tara:strand:- start:17604 stop:17984 length:381 start_codon:yes stop_codon:yes gene_type:complete
MLKKLSSTACILLLAIVSYGQMPKNYIVIGGKKQPAIIEGENIKHWFDNMYLEYTIPDTALTVLIIGDHKFYGDTIRTYRIIETFRKDGVVDKNMSQTNKDIYILNFTPYIHDSIYVSEIIIKDER